jgi:MauM/NapG family ferredoxin protein
MDAIEDDPLNTNYSECIVCQTCVRVCPEDAVVFSSTGFGSKMQRRPFFEERRKLIKAGAWGVGAAVVTLTSLKHLPLDTHPGSITYPELIRPPGALPESEFLARCIRCGECMKACPTNTLQPIGLMAGFSAFYSPKITPRRGPCEPSCNVCGQVCPTGAIRAIALEEKMWAKIGTAHILKHKCLVWEFGKKCLICDEFCPYNAVEFKMVPDIPIAVPYVNEDRCSGCGFCQHHCPVQAEAAIVVEPMGALRLKSGSFRDKGTAKGLSLDIKRDKDDGAAIYQWDGGSSGAGGLPPGFSK